VFAKCVIAIDSCADDSTDIERARNCRTVGGDSREARFRPLSLSSKKDLEWCSFVVRSLALRRGVRGIGVGVGVGVGVRVKRTRHACHSQSFHQSNICVGCGDTTDDYCCCCVESSLPVFPTVISSLSVFSCISCSFVSNAGLIRNNGRRGTYSLAISPLPPW
jgi:hypothetical protein